MTRGLPEPEPALGPGRASRDQARGCGTCRPRKGPRSPWPSLYRASCPRQHCGPQPAPNAPILSAPRGSRSRGDRPELEGSSPPVLSGPCEPESRHSSFLSLLRPLPEPEGSPRASHPPLRPAQASGHFRNTLEMRAKEQEERWETKTTTFPARK